MNQSVIIAILVSIIIIIIAIFIFYKKCRFMKYKRDLPFNLKGYQLRGKITHVIDGDTVKFYHCPLFRSFNENRNYPPLIIRLMGIDAPEKARNEIQPLATESTEYLNKLIKDKMVILKITGEDCYGRIIASIFLKGWFTKLNVNVELVRLGLAVFYNKKGILFDETKEELIRAEHEAKINHRGVWKYKNYEMPWDFRKRQKIITLMRKSDDIKKTRKSEKTETIASQVVN